MYRNDNEISDRKAWYCRCGLYDATIYIVKAALNLLVVITFDTSRYCPSWTQTSQKKVSARAKDRPDCALPCTCIRFASIVVSSCRRLLVRAQKARLSRSLVSCHFLNDGVEARLHCCWLHLQPIEFLGMLFTEATDVRTSSQIPIAVLKRWSFPHSLQSGTSDKDWDPAPFLHNAFTSQNAHSTFSPIDCRIVSFSF